jgi:hypothetical protein
VCSSDLGNACVATFKYRGRLLEGETVVRAFASAAKSERGDFRRCFKSGIEALFEQLHATLEAGE